MEQIKELFTTIEDTRHDGYVKHLLRDVLIMVMGEVICGVTELADMMVYVNKKIGRCVKKQDSYIVRNFDNIVKVKVLPGFVN